MSEHLASLGLAMGILMVGFVSIGPNILAIIGTSMDRGRQQGAKLALGVGLGSGIWATLTVSGLTALISAYAGAMVALKIFGAVYLSWLAYKAFRSAAATKPRPLTKGADGDRLILKGLAISMTNPKAALHWVAIVAVGLGTDAPLWIGLTLIVSATTISIIAHMAYALAFSTQPVVSFYARARRWIEGALGLFFAFAAVKIASART